MSNLISAVAWVRRGVSSRHPHKYVLDDKELERVSALARIELEDARVELERAHEAAKMMGRGGEGEEADDQDDEENWIEFVSPQLHLNHYRFFKLVRTRTWTWTR
jgi:periodic tryptophan protein 1